MTIRYHFPVFKKIFAYNFVIWQMTRDYYKLEMIRQKIIIYLHTYEEGM